MDTVTLVDLAIARIEDLTDQALRLQGAGHEIEKAIVLDELDQLVKAMDSDGDHALWLLYHRYASPSFGVEFEIEHGDEELQFGGV